MKKKCNCHSKTTLVAAALIVTGATAIFGTYAANDDALFSNDANKPSAYCQLENGQRQVLISPENWSK